MNKKKKEKKQNPLSFYCLEKEPRQKSKKNLTKVLT